MGICKTVAALARDFVASKPLFTPHQKLQIELLKLMPLYSDMGNLAAWNSAVMAALSDPDDESETGLLIYEIFSFGRCNMYTAFDEKRTQKECDLLVAELMRFGVSVSPHSGLDDW